MCIARIPLYAETETAPDFSRKPGHRSDERLDGLLSVFIEIVILVWFDHDKVLKIYLWTQIYCKSW